MVATDVGAAQQMIVSEGYGSVVPVHDGEALADALRRRGITRGDTVAVMAPNVPALLEAHYGVPMAGAVLNALNYRLDARSIAFILAHGKAKLLIADREFAPVVKAALDEFGSAMPLVEIEDRAAGMSLGGTPYEAFLTDGDPAADWVMPRDEWEPIALNYLNEKLTLDASEIATLSPLRVLGDRSPPLRLFVGGDELLELRRQSASYAQAARERGLPVALTVLPARHHYSVLDELARPDGAITRALIALIEESARKRG